MIIYNKIRKSITEIHKALKKYIFIILIFLSNYIFSQAPAIDWSKKFGGGHDDFCAQIIETRDNNFIALGYSESASGDVTDHRGTGGSPDIWIFKYDLTGNIIWKRSLGGTASEFGATIQETNDNGFIIFGTTSSNTIDVSGLHVFGGAPFGYSDMWIVKTDSIGQIQWQKCIGSDDEDRGRRLAQTADSGFIIIGEPEFLGGDITTFYGGSDVWIAKLNSVGTILWTRSFGGFWFDTPYGITILEDQSMLITGGLGSSGGNVSCSNSSKGVWIIKVDSSGNELWQKCYGGSRDEFGFDIIKSNDGGFFVAASTASNDGDVTGLIGIYNYWILKCDSAGNILWEKCFGGTGYDQISSITQTKDGGVIACGFSESVIPGSHGLGDAYIVKLDSLGNLEWQKCFGGSGDDQARSVIQLADSSYMIAGNSNSTDGDITNYKGAQDYWIFKLNATFVDISEIYKVYSDLNGSISSESLSIKFYSNITSDAVISVIDILGRVVLTERITTRQGMNDLQIPVNLAKGVFILQLKGANGLISRKIF